MSAVFAPRYQLQTTLVPVDDATPIALLPTAPEPLRSRMVRVLSGGALSAGAIATALGYTPADASALDAETDARIAGDYAAIEIAENRANHYGTQLANTISDFAAATRAVVLAGLSLASPVAIADTDTALVAFGKLQAQITANVASIAANTTAIAAREPTIAAGTTALFYRGDKAWSNFLTGPVGIGAAPGLRRSLDVNATLTGGSLVYGAFSGGEVQSDVTSTAHYFRSNATTQAAAFTLPSLIHFSAVQSTFGAGSTVSIQHGFYADASLIGATTNYGFRGAIPAGTNRFNLYMDGTASNYINGPLGIGTLPPVGYNLYVNRTLTGAANAYGVRASGAVQSDVSVANMFYSVATTQAAAFTVTNLYHFRAEQGAFGAGSTVTNQYGFYVDNSVVGGTNNYGFHGNISAGTGRFNLYCTGSADNHMAGGLGIGTNAVTGYSLRVTKQITGAVTARAVFGGGQIQSDVTTAANIFESGPATVNSVFTLTALRHFYVDPATYGASSTVTTQYGFAVENSLTGAATNYGFHGNIVASGTARWNFYSAGTAPNFFKGSTAFGTATIDASALVNLVSTTQGFLPPRLTTTQKNAIATPTAGLLVYDSTLGGFAGYLGSAWAQLATRLPTIQTIAQPAANTLTATADTTDLSLVTAASAAFTVAAPSGTPAAGQFLDFRFKDNGTGRAITWNAIFRAIGVTLPTTTVANKTLYVRCQYNATDTKWDVYDVKQEA